MPGVRFRFLQCRILSFADAGGVAVIGLETLENGVAHDHYGVVQYPFAECRRADHPLFRVINVEIAVIAHGHVASK